MEANSSALVGPPLAHVLEEELGEEIILFHTENRQFVTLNESAADIWRLCTGEFTSEGIVQRIAGFYGTSRSNVRSEVETAITNFVANGLIDSPGSKA